MTFVIYALAIVAGATAAVLCMHAVWRGVGVYRIKRAGPRHLIASRHRIWRDPGPVERLDLAGGPGGANGAPVPPFAFLEEPAGGSQPTCSVRDARGRCWRVKRAVAVAVRGAASADRLGRIDGALGDQRDDPATLAWWIGRKHAAAANLVSGATHATVGKTPRRAESRPGQGPGRRCAHFRGEVFSRAVERFAEQHVSGLKPGPLDRQD